MRQDEASRIVNALDAEYIRDFGGGNDDVEQAIRIAIKLAVDAADYEGAGALLDIAKHSTWKVRT